MFSVVIIIIEHLEVHHALHLFFFDFFYDLSLEPTITNPLVKLSPVNIIRVIRNVLSVVVRVLETVVFLFFNLNLLLFPYFELLYLFFFLINFNLFLLFLGQLFIFDFDNLFFLVAVHGSLSNFILVAYIGLELEILI